MQAVSDRSTSSRDSKSFLPLLVAVLAAAVGAGAWAALVVLTGREIGFMAWGVGLLVGAAIARTGGRGQGLAVAGAVLAVAGIAGGKLLGTHFLLERDFQQVCEESFTPQLYQEYLQDAADLATLPASPDEAELRRFLLEHHYTGAATTGAIEPSELEFFQAFTAPQLQRLHADQPSFEDWRADCVAEGRQQMDEEFSVVQANLEGLTKVDLLFLVLGVTSAFGLVRRAGESSRSRLAPVPTVTPDSASSAAEDDSEQRRAA